MALFVRSAARARVTPAGESVAARQSAARRASSFRRLPNAAECAIQPNLAGHTNPSRLPQFGTAAAKCRGVLTRRVLATAATSLLFACSSASPVAKTPAEPLDTAYLTIEPEVSLSRTAQPAVEKRAALDPHADVMAEILAIPPGR
jgi:hypothetical protein